MGGYVGNSVINRATTTTEGLTYLDLNVAATISGYLYKVDVWSATTEATPAGNKIKVFRDVGTDYVYVAEQAFNVASGSLQTVTLSPVIAIKAGDYIGVYGSSTADSGIVLEMVVTGGSTVSVVADQSTTLAKASWAAGTSIISIYGYIRPANNFFFMFT